MAQKSGIDQFVASTRIIARPLSKSQNAQASVLMVMMLIPSFALLAFAINIGMLVHAKINLQASADLAAYAGAATQARQMTQISHINYLMRMNYKKFLFKYYVLGNLGLKCFPGTRTNDARCRVNFDQDFDFTNPANDQRDVFPKVPSVCAKIDNTHNICQLNSEISRNLVVRELPCPPGEVTCPAINESLRRIRVIQAADCGAQGAMNTDLALAWLYNTDPRRGFSSHPAIQGWLQDVGLIPANLFLDARISQLEKYINQRRAANVTQRAVSQLENSPDSAYNERTILAYKTAEGNLAAGSRGDATWGAFEPGSLAMDEILPAGATGAELLQLNRITLPDTGMSMFYTYSNNDPLPSGAVPQSGNDGSPPSCALFLGEFKVPGRLVVFGVYKNPATRVYYGVRLRAKAHLLFNPFDDLEIQAYAAAAPFGSRIGPKIDPTTLVKKYNVPIRRAGSNVVQDEERYLPALEFAPGVQYTNAGLLKTFYELLQSGDPRNPVIDTNAVVKGWEVAMAPDPIEVGQYNVPVHFRYPPGTGSSEAMGGGDNLFTRYFASNGVYRIWAPIMPLGGDNSRRSVKEQILEALDETFGGNAVAGGGNTDPRVVVRGALGDGLDSYMSQLNSPSGSALDLGTTANVLAMINPLKYREMAGRVGSGANGALKKIVDAERLATSWFNPAWRSLTAGNGAPAYGGFNYREGYSVKLVSLASVVKGASGAKTSNIPGLGQGWAPVNPGDFGGEAAADLPKLNY